jgi:hypothetical protein
MVLETSALVIYSVFLSHVTVFAEGVGIPGVFVPPLRYGPGVLTGSPNKN